MAPFTAMNVVHPAAADAPPALAPASAPTPTPPTPTPASPRAIAPTPAHHHHSPSLSPTSAVGIPHGLRSDHSAHHHHHHHHQYESHYVHHAPPHSPTPTPSSHSLHQSPRQHQQSHHQLLQSAAAAATSASAHPSSPPLRQDTSSSISTQATAGTHASAETSNTSYSADTPPNPHQSIFSLKDGSDVSYSNISRTSRRRTGPLSQASRERAALIRKLGACNECRKRRVACNPGHHNMTWEELQGKFRKSMSPGITPELARPFMPPHATGQTNGAHSFFTQDPQEMDIDSAPSDDQQLQEQQQQQLQHQQHHVGLPSISDARNRTPLPGSRLEKSLSLPGIESLKNDLQTNVSRMLSTGARTRYSTVEALLMFWEHDDDFSIVNGAVNELAEVFGQFYHYTFRTLHIPSPSESCKSPGRWLSRQLNDFVEDRDLRDVLKIVFYAGHSHLDANRDMTLASSKDIDKASTIRWSAIQQVLEDACSDVLILMDAAYYPSSKMVRNRGVLELIAASVSEEHHDVLDRCAFTRALADQLRTRATRLSPVSAAELHAALLAAYPKLIQERNPEKETITSFPAPLHIMMSGNPRLPSIFLSPVFQGSPLRSSSLGYENNPQLHLSIRLNDDNVDVEIWNEWLRLMPEGIKDVRVEGPYRPTYR